MRTPAGRYVSPNLHTWVGRAPGPCCPRGAEAFELHLCRDLCMIPRSCSCLPTRRHHRAQTTGSSMSPPCQILRTQGPREPEAWTRASRALPGSAQHHFAMSGGTGPLWSSLRTSQRIRLGDPQGLAPHAHISVTLRDPKTPCTHRTPRTWSSFLHTGNLALIPRLHPQAAGVQAMSRQLLLFSKVIYSSNIKQKLVYINPMSQS